MAVSPQWFDPTSERQRAVSEALRQQAAQPMQGQMVSGRYVAPSITQGLSKLFSGYASGRLGNLADERERTQRSELADALRGPKAEPDSLQGRLGGLRDNPQAQQLAMQLALRRAESEGKQFQMLAPEQAKAMGLGPGQWGMDPSGKPVQVYKPEQPKAPGMLIQNERGEWVPNPTYMQAKEQIARAGRSTTNINNTVGGDAAPELGKLATDYGYVLDPKTRQPIIDPSTGLPMAAPVPGSKEARSMEAEQADAARRQDVRTVSDAEKSGAMLDSISDLKKVFESADTPVTGTMSRPFAVLSGTPAGRARSLIGPLKSGVAIGALSRLKESSATGASGFGALNTAELQLLIDDIGALDPDTTEPDIFLKTVDRIGNRYERIIKDIKSNVSPERIRELGLEPLIGSIESQGLSPEEEQELQQLRQELGQ